MALTPEEAASIRAKKEEHKMHFDGQFGDISHQIEECELKKIGGHFRTGGWKDRWEDITDYMSGFRDWMFGTKIGNASVSIAIILALGTGAYYVNKEYKIIEGVKSVIDRVLDVAELYKGRTIDDLNLNNKMYMPKMQSYK